MSTHVEWLAAHATTVEVVKRGTAMPDDQEVTYHLALVLSADGVVVVEGSRDRLLAILRRALREVEATPAQPHTAPPGTVLPTQAEVTQHDAPAVLVDGSGHYAYPPQTRTVTPPR